jgi:periplasmic protein TonB
MEANKILTANVLDILFENRNKDYGAYELRNNYNKRMSGSLLIMFIIIFISFIFYSFSNTSSIKTVTNNYRDSVKITIVNIEPELPMLPKPQPAIQIKSAIYTAPLILKDEIVRKEDLSPELETLMESKIDLVNQSGLVDEGIAPTLDTKSILVYPKNEIIDYNEPFTAVEVEASFKGGGEAWRKYVLRNLNANVPINNGATSGVYTIIVQFIVDTDGNISNVIPLTKHGYGMEDEAMRVIRSGPKWEPAIQNGRKVKAYRKQPITFVVTEG